MSTIDQMHQAVAGALATLLGKRMTVGPAAAAPADPSAGGQGEYLEAEVTFQGGVAGRGTWLIPKREALTMVGMMMSMGDDAQIAGFREGAFGDGEKDAMKEIMNQVASSAATFLREKAGKASASLGRLEMAEAPGALAAAGPGAVLARASLGLEGFEEAPMYLLLDAGLAAGLGAGQAAPSAPAAPQPHAPARQAHGGEKLVVERIRGLEVVAEAVLADREMKVKDLLGVCVGSVIEFKKLCDSPINLEIGSRAFANGEVLVSQDGRYALRVLETTPTPS